MLRPSRCFYSQTTDSSGGWSDYQVVANVAETDIAQIQVSSNVTSFEVRVNLAEDVQSQLRPGMNVDVEFQAGALTNVLVVPTVAIVLEEQGEGVLILGRDSTPSPE